MMQFGRVLCVVVAICVAAQTQTVEREARDVRIASGTVRGYKEDDLYIFYSIPYATAPTGTNRFKGPLPAPSWMGVYDAVDQKIACVQTAPSYNTTEDLNLRENCLIANVFAPDTNETNLSVVVYVHGGAYQVGFGNGFQPRSLTRSKKIVAVTFNYRLGVHGFLCLGTEDVPGNAGMKDQVALLRWVQRNIAAFGGNPNDVTIAGTSAGGSSVDLLMLSKSAKGLFHKVIPESGANLAPWSIQPDPLEIAKEFAQRLNFTNVDNVYALEEFYKTASFEQLTSVSDTLMSRPDSSFVFSPCVERGTESESFLDDAPINILKNEDYDKVPILYGFAQLEGLFRIERGWDLFKDRMNEKFSDFLPIDLEFNTEEEREEVAKRAKEFYFGDKAIGEDTVFEYIDYFTDVLFAYPTLRAVKYHTEAGHNQIYLYEYSFPEEQPLPESLNLTISGAHHAAQTAAILDNPLALVSDNAEYERMREVAREMWINFITTGSPVPVASALPSWPAVTSSRAPYMQLTLPPALHTGPLLGRRARFWDDIYDKHYRVPIPPPALP